MRLSLFEAVSLLAFFWINVVFPLVIHSITYAPCKQLFIISACLHLEGKFLNQKPCISWPGVCLFDIFWCRFE